MPARAAGFRFDSTQLPLVVHKALWWLLASAIVALGAALFWALVSPVSPLGN